MYVHSMIVYFYENALFVLLTFIFIILIPIGFERAYKLFMHLQNPLRHMTIIKADTQEKSIELSSILTEDSCKLRALGFDCEWVTVDNKQQPISLLQLASTSGVCGLYRLNILKKIPEDLKKILEDLSIIKLGVCPRDDAKYLFNNFGVQVNSCLDIRHLYPVSGGLASLSKQVLGVTLDKRWYIRCSDWEAETLSNEQIEYAAKDALVSIEIFKKWLLNHQKSNFFLVQKRDYHTLAENLKDEIKRYLDVPYHAKIECNNLAQPKKESSNNCKILNNINEQGKRGFATRKSPLYHNCFMYAPDGELLCSCDVRKAEWYLEKGLAERMPGEPYSIKLLFEPSGRAGEKNEGRYYTQLKQNCCVVCGIDNSYLRHKVVPREYRKHFPSILKDHQSHDVVLTCLKCHRLASLHDEALREKLAIMCDAPINNRKMIDLKTAKKIQGAAKALLSTNNIPLSRRNDLEKEIKKFYKTDDITPEILQNCMNLETKVMNENYEPHGLKVVNYFINKNGGILELEKMWRQHFLDTMKPQFLPALWSITHNHERLAKRAAEHRVKPADLEIAGFQPEMNKTDA